MRRYTIFIFFMFIAIGSLFAEEKEEDKKKEEKPLKIGNFALPTSQQPTPLISFGQNLLDKKQAQAQIFAGEIKGEEQYFITTVPCLLYGFTDNFSIFLFAPISIRNRYQHDRSSGGGDAIIQLEYAYYTKTEYTYVDQATVLANITIPTGSNRKNPITGLGANSFFVGATFCRNAIDWLCFSSYGGLITTTAHRTKFGNQFLYQFGVGGNIKHLKNYIIAWMVEFNGTYAWKDIIQGSINHDSGGNVMTVTPSLWFSSENFFLHLGPGWFVQQRLNGCQNNNHYLLALNSGWTF